MSGDEMTFGERYQMLTGRPHRIGVFDSESCEAHIRHCFERIFPDLPARDPQWNLDLMEAEILKLRSAGSPTGAGETLPREGT
jgi:hypothetical protein